ncbi:hypothetical protein [Demequina sp. SO4-18]|uniref:hypothetical protein n=1 Tax=Demequina sp. SO4-18 TaxID=3401026 RepID=UPI003B5A378C
MIALALAAGALVPAAGAWGVAAESQDEPSGGVGIRLVDAPVATAENPRANVYIIDHVAPGTVIERRVEVSNSTGESTIVTVYPAAAQIADGNFVGEPEATQNELSSWIAVSPSAPELASGEQAEVDVEIDVPADATVGEHYGVIWAEVTDAPESGGVTAVTRVGIRIYLSVGEGTAPVSDFTIGGLTASRTDDGSPSVEATVTNSGERALDLTAQVSLSDGPGGVSAGPFSTEPVTTLGIGESAPMRVDLDPLLPNGPWRADVTVTSGLEERSIEAELTFPEAGATAEATVDDGVPLVVVIAIVVLAALAAVIGAIVFARKRSQASLQA